MVALLNLIKIGICEVLDKPQHWFFSLPFKHCKRSNPVSSHCSSHYSLIFTHKTSN